VAHIITHLDQGDPVTLAALHQAATHKVDILVTIIKAMLLQDLEEQVVISMDTGGRMDVLVLSL
jgi:hypothetical protein